MYIHWQEKLLQKMEVTNEKTPEYDCRDLPSYGLSDTENYFRNYRNSFAASVYIVRN